MRMQALRAGAVEFMAKPFNDEALARECSRQPWQVEALIGVSGARKEAVSGSCRNIRVRRSERDPRRFEQIIGKARPWNQCSSK